MRMFLVASVLVMSFPLSAQQPAAASQAADSARTAYVSAAELAALVAKQPADRNGTISRLLQFAPYSVNVEHRVAVPQTASVHEAAAELFYVIDGGATLVTGGTLIEPTRNGTNLSSTKGVQGGASQKLAKGDFALVPAGVPHWFTDIQGSITQMALHLPVVPGAK